MRTMNLHNRVGKSLLSLLVRRRPSASAESFRLLLTQRIQSGTYPEQAGTEAQGEEVE